MNYILFFLILILASSPASADSNKVQKIINKGITDINSIKINKSTRRLVIKKNDIDSIQDFTIDTLL